MEPNKKEHNLTDIKLVTWEALSKPIEEVIAELGGLDYSITKKDSLVEFHFTDVSGVMIGIENTLEDLYFPYDKFWQPSRQFNSGCAFFRVRQDGRIKCIEYDKPIRGYVKIDSVISAMRDGEIFEFIQQAYSDQHVLDWDIQIKIIKARDHALAYLANTLDDAERRRLIDKAMENIADWPEFEQLKKQASDIYESTPHIQAYFLLSIGYMTPDLQRIDDELFDEPTVTDKLSQMIDFYSNESIHDDDKKQVH